VIGLVLDWIGFPVRVLIPVLQHERVIGFARYAFGLTLPMTTQFHDPERALG